MLQVIRDKTQGFFAWAVILLIAGIFAFLGLNDYFSARGSATNAVVVDGEPISWRSVDAFYQRVLREQEVPIENEQALKMQVVAALAQRLALLIGLKTQGFVINPQQVIDVLKKNPAFEVDGHFSKEQFKTIMANIGYTEDEYAHELSQDMLRNQLPTGLSLSFIPSKQELARAVQLLDQTRNLRYIIIPAQQYYSEIASAISAEELKKYYEAHQPQFISPEKVAVDYIELSIPGLMNKIPVTESELQAFYEQNRALFGKPEQVHARHILISAVNQDKQLAAKKAEEILAKINKGEDFATVAKAESNDKSSSEAGGDLGWFGRNEMAPALEKAIFDLKNSGDVAGPISTDYGYHIVQLIDRKAAGKHLFSDSKELVEEHYRRTQAEALFEKLKAEWIKLARENPEDLKPIADALGLNLNTTVLFSKQPEKGITIPPEAQKAAFSDNVLVKRKNSELIKITDAKDLKENALMMVHLNDHKPSHQQSLEEVQPQIQERLVSERAVAKAKATGDALVASLKEGTEEALTLDKNKILAELSNEHQINWITKTNVVRANQDLDRTILMNAFKLPAPDVQKNKPSVMGFVLPNGDYVALAVTRVKLGDIDKVDAGTKTAYQKSITDMNHQIEYGLYVHDILSKAKVKFSESPFEE